MFILCVDVSSIDEGMKFFRPKHTDKHSLSNMAHLVSVSLKVLLGNAIWQGSCSRAAPGLNSYMLVLMVMGFSLLQ